MSVGLLESSLYPIFTFSPALVNIEFAASSDFPITLSTSTCFIPVPLLTYNLTVSPAFTSLSPAGSWSITIPASTVLLVWSILSTFKFALSNICAASSYVLPFTFSTIAFSVPLLITIFIVEFSFTVYPSIYGGS